MQGGDVSFASWAWFSLLYDGKKSHIGEKNGKSKAAPTYRARVELWICGGLFVRIKFKPVKDYGAYSVQYFPSSLRPEKWLIYQWVVELCILYCVLEYA